MRARGAGPQLTYLIPHVHADRAGLTRPLQTLPVRRVKKASKAATARGHCCPQDGTLASAMGTRPPWPPHGWPSAWQSLPPAPGLWAQSREDTERGAGSTSQMCLTALATVPAVGDDKSWGTVIELLSEPVP